MADERFSARNILSSVLLAAAVAAAFYFIFHDFLEVPLPEGRWFA